MLRKIIGSLLALALAGFGIALMAGFLDPEELTGSNSGRAKGRLLKNVMRWLVDTLGPVGGGAVILVAGLGLLYFTWKPEKPAAEDE